MVPAAMTRRWITLALLVAATACVAAPEAARDGGTRCTRNEACNQGATCGELHLCVLGYCAVDTVYTVCTDGGADVTQLAECLTWVDCNPANACGTVFGCRAGRCERDVPTQPAPCVDAGR